MKKLFFLLSIFSSAVVYSQENIYGEYFNFSENVRCLLIKPNGSFVLQEALRVCNLSPIPVDSGTYAIKNDTIFLNFKSSDSMYFLIRADNTDSIFKEKKIKLVFSDAVKLYSSHRPTFEYPYLTQKSSLYANGNLKFRINESDNKKIINYYYPNGRIKLIECYEKGLKTGMHYFYSSDGELTKTENYRKGKLKETENYY